MSEGHDTDDDIHWTRGRLVLAKEVIPTAQFVASHYPLLPNILFKIDVELVDPAFESFILQSRTFRQI